MSAPAPLTQDDLTTALDQEIDVAAERERSQGITSWAIGASIFALLAVGAALFEAGGLRWKNVGLLFLTGVLTAHVLAFLFYRSVSDDKPATPVPFTLWSHPSAAAMVQRVALLVLAIYLRDQLPSWALALSAIVFTC